jgi:hypothetical protein
MSLRVPMILQLLEAHEFVLFADVDIAWLKSPLDYLEKVLAAYPIAMQTEAVGQFPPPFCMGFMAMRAGEATTRILSWFQSQYALDRQANPQAAMQVTMNRIVAEDVEEAKNIFPLPEALFPNGRLYRAVQEPARFETPLVALPEPYIFHANWTIGIQAKQALLSACRLWATEADDLAARHAESLSRAGVDQYQQEISQLQAELEAGRQTLVAVSEQLIATDAALKTRTEHTEFLTSELADRTEDVVKMRERLAEHTAHALP